MTRNELRYKQLILHPRIQELYKSIEHDHCLGCWNTEHGTCKVQDKDMPQLIMLEKEYHNLGVLIIENDRGVLERGEIVFTQSALDTMNKLEKMTKNQLELIKQWETRMTL